jgi:hypothetical protein
MERREIQAATGGVEHAVDAKEGATMASTDATRQPYRELAHRDNDGVEVVLFWHEITDELTVTVSDQRTGAYFELAADPGQALDVFDHPYAHAAFRGLPYAEASPATWAQAAANRQHVITDRSGKPTS